MPIILTMVGNIRMTRESSGICVPFRRFASQRFILSPRKPAQNIAASEIGKTPHYTPKIDQKPENNPFASRGRTYVDEAN